MRSKEQFKAELFRRRAEYERRRKKKRTALLAACFSGAACAAICCMVFLPSLFAGKPAGMKNENLPVNPESVSSALENSAMAIEIKTLPESERKRCTNQKQIKEFLSCLNGLTLTPAEECSVNEFLGMSYIITVTYGQEKTVTYTFFGNRYRKRRLAGNFGGKRGAPETKYIGTGTRLRRMI